LKPEIREERERQKKAKKEKLMVAAEESVNMLSAPFLILMIPADMTLSAQHKNPNFLLIYKQHII